MNIEKSKVLIVDDSKTVLNMVSAWLEPAGVEVAKAEGGLSAIELLDSFHPDAMLLDVEMPDMNGYQVCKTIRQNLAWKNLPILFLTSKSEEEDILEGFEAGADDYLLKPVQPKELLARVLVHLQNATILKQLTRQNLELSHLIKEKDDLLTMVAHDIRNPLAAAKLSFDLIQKELGDNKTPHLIKYAELVEHSLSRILTLVSSLVEMRNPDSARKKCAYENIEVSHWLLQLIQPFELLYQKKGVNLNWSISPRITWPVDQELCATVLNNYLSNALKFSFPGQKVNIAVKTENSILRFEVQDQGPGIKPEEEKLLFQKYARLSNKPTAGEQSTDLGLGIAKNAADLMGAQVGWKANEPQGSIFYLQINQSQVS